MKKVLFLLLVVSLFLLNSCAKQEAFGKAEQVLEEEEDTTEEAYECAFMKDGKTVRTGIPCKGDSNSTFECMSKLREEGYEFFAATCLKKKK